MSNNFHGYSDPDLSHIEREIADTLHEAADILDTVAAAGSAAEVGTPHE